MVEYYCYLLHQYRAYITALNQENFFSTLRFMGEKEVFARLVEAANYAGNKQSLFIKTLADDVSHLSKQEILEVRGSASASDTSMSHSAPGGEIPQEILPEEMEIWKQLYLLYERVNAKKPSVFNTDVEQLLGATASEENAKKVSTFIFPDNRAGYKFASPRSSIIKSASTGGIFSFPAGWPRTTDLFVPPIMTICGLEDEEHIPSILDLLNGEYETDEFLARLGITAEEELKNDLEFTLGIHDLYTLLEARIGKLNEIGQANLASCLKSASESINEKVLDVWDLQEVAEISSPAYDSSGDDYQAISERRTSAKVLALRNAKGKLPYLNKAMQEEIDVLNRPLNETYVQLTSEMHDGLSKAIRGLLMPYEEDMVFFSQSNNGSEGSMEFFFQNQHEKNSYFALFRLAETPLFGFVSIEDVLADEIVRVELGGVPGYFIHKPQWLPRALVEREILSKVVGYILETLSDQIERITGHKSGFQIIDDFDVTKSLLGVPVWYHHESLVFLHEKNYSIRLRMPPEMIKAVFRGAAETGDLPRYIRGDEPPASVSGMGYQAAAFIISLMDKDNALSFLRRFNKDEDKAGILDALRATGLLKEKQVKSFRVLVLEEMPELILGDTMNCGKYVASELADTLGKEIGLDFMDMVMSIKVEREIIPGISEISSICAFEDIGNLCDRDTQAWLKQVAYEDLTLAMKVASQALSEKVINNMSRIAAEMLKNDLESLGPVREKDVEKSQAAIVRIVRHLIQEGKVVDPADLVTTTDIEAYMKMTVVRDLGFGDIANLPDSQVQALLMEVDRDTLFAFLCIASAPVREKLLEGMSLKARMMMEEDLSSAGPVSRRNVASILTAIRDVFARLS